MNTGNSDVDPAFIERQQQYLLRLRDALASAVGSERAEEDTINAEGDGGPQEREDDAQRLAALERDGTLVVRDSERLARVQRALEKIANGTYGLSDVSGHRIPRERLEAVPEAIRTFSEEKNREG